MKTKILLAQQITKNRKKIWEWYDETAKKAPPPFYCSIDLRDSGFKVTPVDSNLYPAGFNNICPEDLRTASLVFRKQIEEFCLGIGRPTPKQILILPESHTQNLYYAENLYYLLQIITNAGFEARVGWYGELPGGFQGPVHLKSSTGKEIPAYPIRVEGGVASADGFVPDVILLNNDFSAGYPKPLDAVTQPILPSHVLGWHTRKKSEHFKFYNQLAAEFASIAEIDPWFIQVDTQEVSPVDFNNNIGVEEVAQAVDGMLARIRQNYESHKVKHEPFVFVKNNAGTYGMGIMVVRGEHGADEIRHMNRRTKNKMSVGKNHMQIGSVAIQEGVPTATLVNRMAAEPVIYLFRSELIGGFLRTNAERGSEENLNAPGMVFKKLCMSDLRKPEEEDETPASTPVSKEPVLELVYGSIAKISALAAGMELKHHVH